LLALADWKQLPRHAGFTVSGAPESRTPGGYQVVARGQVMERESALIEKGFISFAARKSAGRRTGLTAAKVMKPCSELNRRRRVGL
jgi:hypothetical protein